MGFHASNEYLVQVFIAACRSFGDSSILIANVPLMVKYMEDASAKAIMIFSIANSCEANASPHTTERTNARKKSITKETRIKKIAQTLECQSVFRFTFFAYFVLMLFIRLSTPDLCSSPDRVSFSDSMQQLLHIRAESVARLVGSSTTLHRAHKCVVM